MGADAVPGGSDVAVTTVPPDRAPSAPSDRAAKMAAAREGLSKLAAASAPAQTETAPPPDAGPKAEAAAPLAEKPVDETDPLAAKGLEAIEKRDARAREKLKADIAAAKAEIERERAEVARMRADAEKPSPLDELKKLPLKERYREALKRLDVDPDDEEAMEVVARDAYSRSKSGKADPKNKVHAEQVAEKRALETELAELKKQIAEVRDEFKTRDQRTEAERFAQAYLDTAVKAIPAEPTFIGQLHATNPQKARAALLSIGQQLERDLGETPSHAEVIAEYEKRRRADLADHGLTKEQVDALLKKPAPVAAKPAPTRTLDPDARPTTPPINGNPTRDQKIAAARAGLRKLNAEA